MLAENKGSWQFLKSKNLLSCCALPKILAQSQNVLEDRLNQSSESLSGASVRRFTWFIARCKAELLLLDEHTAALDPKSADKIMELTDELVTGQELTCLMITNNLQEALTYGNRLVILKEGAIVADFSAAEKAQLTKEILYPYFM